MAISPDEITPALEQIGSYIRNRTGDRLGRKSGTFTENTIPTADEAGIVADRAARHVALELGAPYTQWDGDLLASATDIAAVYAALQIETGYFSDGSGQETGTMEQLGRMFREQIAALKRTARNNQVGGNRMHSVQMVRARRRT